METYPDCIPCLINQALKAMRLCNIPESGIMPSLQKVLRCIAELNTKQTPPEMAMYIHRIIREECGSKDPYLQMKKEAVDTVLQHKARIRSIIESSPKPFRTAVRFAIVGNVLDFAIFDFDEKRLNDQLNNALHYPIDESALDRLEKAVDTAQNILVIGDNAGESVFDKLLIEQLKGKDVIYAVRGKPAINDVTMPEAIDSGLNKVATLRSNNSDAPGTLLAHVSEEFLQDFDAADLVIAKGQGNYESLSGCHREVFFLTQVKCPVIARDLRKNVGDWVIAENLAAGEQ